MKGTLKEDHSHTGHRWRKVKDLLVFCSGKNLLGIVSWFLFCFFVLRHLCPVLEVNALFIYLFIYLTEPADWDWYWMSLFGRFV